MHYEYVEEVKQSAWNWGKAEVKEIEKKGRKITRSRFERLVKAEHRKYAEVFARQVCRRFSTSKARYITGDFRGRKAVVMFFSGRGWLFAEPLPPRTRDYANVQPDQQQID